MSDLSATQCACGRNGLSCGGSCGINSCTLIIILLLCCGGCGDGGFGGGCGNDCSCIWIILLFRRQLWWMWQLRRLWKRLRLLLAYHLAMQMGFGAGQSSGPASGSGQPAEAILLVFFLYRLIECIIYGRVWA